MQYWQRPGSEEVRAWMGMQVGLVGEHGKSRRVMGNNLTWAVTGLRC